MVNNGDCTLKTRFFTDGLFNLVLVWFLNQEHHSALNLPGLPQLLTSTCAMCMGDYDWFWMLSDVGMCIVICQYFLNYTLLSSRPGAIINYSQTNWAAKDENARLFHFSLSDLEMRLLSGIVMLSESTVSTLTPTWMPDSCHEEQPHLRPIVDIGILLILNIFKWYFLLILQCHCSLYLYVIDDCQWQWPISSEDVYNLGTGVRGVVAWLA